MKIGLVGYQGSGKSTLFGWLTGVEPDPAQAHTSQTAMATVHDPRVKQLCEIYEPKKITEASIELVDTPGLARDQKGNAARLAAIRDCDTMIVVLAGFGDGNPQQDVTSFQEDLALADLEIISNRITRLEESIKKPRPDREDLIAEKELLESMQKQIEDGVSLRELEISADDEKRVRSFQLLSLKPLLAIVNTADDEEDPTKFESIGGEGLKVIPVPIGLEAELARMEPDEAAAFREEMGVGSFDRDPLVLAIMAASGQMLFFTAGEKEVRTWMFLAGGTAVDAADCIHSDLARGFIRAEIMTIDDLVRLGSEREVKAAGLARQEMKDYVVQDGDVLFIKSGI